MAEINNRLKIEIPFAGFYETWHDEEIDRAIQMHFEDDQGDLPEGVAGAIWESDIDWSAIRKEYCADFVDWFGNEFGLNLEFDDMWSPREYNFSSDRIFAIADKDEFDTKIRKVVEAYPEWPQIIKERFTSYDGFWSNYSNDYQNEEWTRDVLDECQYKVMLQAYIDHLHTEDPLNNPAWNEHEYRCFEDMELSSFKSIMAAVDKVEEKLKETHARNN